jgi:hypothetical protein
MGPLSPVKTLLRSSPRKSSAALGLLLLLALASVARGESPAKDAAAQPAAAAKAESKFAVNADGYLVVGFDQLASFEFVPPATDAADKGAPAAATKGAEQIPERIRALDGQKAAVTGFMLPVKMDKGLVTEFLLVKDAMMCCYGVMPKLNEWIVVKMTGAGVPPLMDTPVIFEGKLKVGELYDNGYLTGIYLLEGERQAEKKKG